MNYEDFINSKRRLSFSSGIQANDLNPFLKEFQKFSVKIALQKGRFALFEDCGLGKTIQQLEWANQVSKHTNQPVLILAPLAVTDQTIQEGRKFNIDVNEIGSGYIQISNYEQLDNIDTSLYSGVVMGTL